MARPPSIRRLLVEDFPPDQQQWIGTLLQILNQFMDQTGFALNNNLTLTENSLVQIRTIDFTGNAGIRGDISTGTNTITNVSSTYDLETGFTITGEGIPDDTTITNIAGNTITISNNATATVVGLPIIIGNSFPINFQYTLPTQPLGLQILNIFEDEDNPRVITEAPHPDWELINGQIVINHITGLRLNTNYQATIVVYGT